MPKLTIYPYLYEETCWVFDDQRTGLKEEAFVLGMTEMISRVVEAKAIPNAAKGFALTFGVEPFDHDVELTLLSPAEAVEALSPGGWHSRHRQLVSGNRLRRGNGRLALSGVILVLPRSAEEDLCQG